MIKQHDHLATFCWYKEVITDPYQVIAAFFDHGDIAYYRKLVKGLLLHACSHKIYHKNAPGNLLFESKMLESLIRAADAICKAKTKITYAIPKEEFFDKKWYCSRRYACDEWDHFPKVLSKKEYADPCRVFARFFAYQPLHVWLQHLHEILIYALTKNTEPVEMDLLAIYFHLAKLLEAAHLIEVRGEEK